MREVRDSEIQKCNTGIRLSHFRMDLSASLKSLIFLLFFFGQLAATAQDVDDDANLPQDEDTTDSVAENDTLPEDSTLIWPANLQERLDHLAQNPIFERTQLGMCIYDLTADSMIYSRGERQLLRPASTEKLLTSITALSQLGGSYRFETKMYYSGSIADSVLTGNIYVVGGFDPRLGHDDIRGLCAALHSLGIWRIAGNVCLDVSMKDTLRWGYGWCWDDDLTRLTPLLLNGKDRFEEGLRQALTDEGITYNETFLQDKVPGDATFVTSRFHTIDQILMRMMKNSDNLYAESVFYQLGAQSGVSYPSWKRSAQKVKDLIRDMGLNPSDYRVADGSGLSLYNYATPELLTKALRYAYQRNYIYLHLYPSLPIAGKDGTLRHRMRSGTAYGNVHAKTGTVEGVSTLAGYATAANGHELCFAIMNQGLLYHSTGKNFQDRVCQAITKP